MNTEIKSIFREQEKYIGQSLVVSGWIRTTRESKNAAFIELNDGTFFKNLQVVFDGSLANAEEIKKTSIGAAIRVIGNLVKSSGAEQSFELKAESIEVVG